MLFCRPCSACNVYVKYVICKLFVCSCQYWSNPSLFSVFHSCSLSASSAPKWKTPSTATSTRRTPTCSGIPCSWWRPSPTPRPTTSTTPWWAPSSTTARPTATASSVMCSWMCVWTTETLRGVLLLPWLPVFMPQTDTVFYSWSRAVVSSHVNALPGWTISGSCVRSWRRIVAPWVPSGSASSRLSAAPPTTATVVSMICCVT